jgi:hypothetical protein
MAETATTTSFPSFFASTIRRATRLMAEASARDEPPYFCTTMPTDALLALIGAPAPGQVAGRR